VAVDFDTPIARRGSASFKWDLYPEDVLPLWVADMDFASPPPVVAALQARAAHGVFGYSVVPNSLVEAVVGHLASRYDWRVDPQWLVWLPSVVPGLDLACRAFAAEGEGVMTVTPVYPPFLAAPPDQGRRLITVPAVYDDASVDEPGPTAAREHGPSSPGLRGTGDAPLGAPPGIAPRAIPLATRWRLPLADMDAACEPDTRVLLFCHPHNPLGRVWRREEVEQVVAFCREHGLVLCSDEIHCDLVLGPLQHVPAALTSAEAAEVTVTLMAPSKTFNLPGLNFAFAVISDEDLRRRFAAAGEGLLPFPGCFAIAATEAAYREGGPWLAELLDYLRANAELVERFVHDELPNVRMTHVEATYHAWLDVRAVGLSDPGAACVRAGDALSDGAAFGAPGFLRLNFACPRVVLVEALSRLRIALA
jgi:cystathionine beta-lyase